MSRDQVAFCMVQKISNVYLSDNLQSKNLEQYIGEYVSAITVTPCKTPDEKKECNAEIQGYIEEDKMYLRGRRYSDIGYPVVVLSKTGAAYLIPSTADIEELLGCGSLRQ